MTIATVEASGDHGAVRIHLSGELILTTCPLLTSKSAPQCPASRQWCRWT